MITLVIGGASSGKSSYAETLVLSRGDNRIYVATMEPFGEEGASRIRKHREMRAGKGFRTVECASNLAGIAGELEGANVLLEDLPNLVANEIFGFEGRSDDDILKTVSGGLKAIAESSTHLTIVTGDLTSDGIIYDESTERYLKLLGALNREAGRIADEVLEISCGQLACRFK